MKLLPNNEKQLLYFTLLFVFFVGFISFFAGRSYIARDCFGGDLHNISFPDSYSFNMSKIKNETAFFSKLNASSSADSADTPRHFIYNLLSDKGKESLRKLISGEGLDRDRNAFIYEFNVSVVDKAVVWPSNLLKKTGIDETSFKKLTGTKQNLSFIRGTFPEETDISFFESPSFIKSILNIPNVAKMYFTLKDPTRYTPVSNVFIHTMQFYLYGRPDRIFVGIFFMSIFWGLSALLMTLFAYEIIGSLFWAVLAAFLFQTSMSVLCSSYMLFSLPYVFVNIFSFATFISYLHFKKTGEKIWLVFFTILGILCPWVREFSDVENRKE